ncbi:hypothetical protein NPIL_229061 [Nephila pilipes]|uniref:Uncharacterized protein n=1 Tax=Nephila pilipes TaxID=299642 RepID=A0A8X6QJQ9_NEPPI|nr:hypothetical protein NPIL_229061 [Nephila pilipes]
MLDTLPRPASKRYSLGLSRAHKAVYFPAPHSLPTDGAMVPTRYCIFHHLTTRLAQFSTSHRPASQRSASAFLRHKKLFPLSTPDLCLQSNNLFRHLVCLSPYHSYRGKCPLL